VMVLQVMRRVVGTRGETVVAIDGRTVAPRVPTCAHYYEGGERGYRRRREGQGATVDATGEKRSAQRTSQRLPGLSEISRRVARLFTLTLLKDTS
jgi:hypothetical protein